MKEKDVIRIPAVEGAMNDVTEAPSSRESGTLTSTPRGGVSHEKPGAVPAPAHIASAKTSIPAFALVTAVVLAVAGRHIVAAPDVTVCPTGSCQTVGAPGSGVLSGAFFVTGGAPAATRKAPDLATATRMVLDAVPDGSTITFDQLRGRVGKEIAGLISVVVTPATVTRNGNKVAATSPGVTRNTVRGIEVTAAAAISFQVAQAGDNLSFTDIEGLTIDAGITMPSMDLKEVRARTDGQGNTVLKASLKVAAFLPYVRYSFTLSASGKATRTDEGSP